MNSYAIFYYNIEIEHLAFFEYDFRRSKLTVKNSEKEKKMSL